MKTKYIGIALVLIVGIGALVWFLGSGDKTAETNTDSVAAGDPLDAVLPFYNAYLDALVSTSTTPEAAGIMGDPVLSEEVRTAIAQSDATTVDPVLCQSVTPEKVRARTLFDENGEAQVQVLGRGDGEKSPEQAVVSLTVVDGEWRITGIECVYGESAPEREYSFERDGYILKSVPEPLNSDYWHLVFEQNGQMGHTVPLFFDEFSICIQPNGTEVVCDESQLVDATKAIVQGEMTEAGANVKRLQLFDE